MSFERTHAVGVPLTVLPHTGSTNADLLARAADAAHLTTIATLDQRSGRGRLDRAWVAPAGQALAVSVLVRADLDPVARGWLPLAAGTAMRDAIAAVLPDPDAVGVKWPNDVLVGPDGRKVCGILAQVAADGSVVVGAGVNLTVPAPALPTATSTSLAVAGAHGDADALADAVLAGFWVGFREAVAALARSGAAARSVRQAVRTACATIGREVRLDLPDGSTVVGEAVGIDDEARLQFRNGTGAVTAISVGDVTHLRYA